MILLCAIGIFIKAMLWLLFFSFCTLLMSTFQSFYQAQLRTRQEKRECHTDNRSLKVRQIKDRKLGFLRRCFLSASGLVIETMLKLESEKSAASEFFLINFLEMEDHLSEIHKCAHTDSGM